MASRRHLWMRDRTSKVEVFLSKECEELRENELSEVKTWIEDKQKLNSTRTSRKNTNVKTHANAEKVAGTAQGRKYGYFFRNSEFPKAPGKRSAGCDSEPPIVGLQDWSVFLTHWEDVSLTRAPHRWTKKLVYTHKPAEGLWGQ